MLTTYLTTIEWLRLTSQAVKHPQHSVLFRFTHKTARQESSKFYGDLRNASSLALTKYYCINCCCSEVTMPIKLSSYVTWSTSETVASVQLPLNAVFFCLAEVVSFVTSMQPLYCQHTWKTAMQLSHFWIHNRTYRLFATYNKRIWLIVEYTIHELVLDNLYVPLRTDQSTVVSPCACKVR